MPLPLDAKPSDESGDRRQDAANDHGSERSSSIAKRLYDHWEHGRFDKVEACIERLLRGVSARSADQSRSVTSREMDRRRIMCDAKILITEAMSEQTDVDGLTAMEWVQVLHECQARIIAHGLREEWTESNQSGQGSAR